MKFFKEMKKMIFAFLAAFFCVLGYIKVKNDFYQARIESARFSEGLASFSDKNGSVGFINQKGDWIIMPQFEGAGFFYNGTAPVKIKGKWGIINRKGDFLISPNYFHPPSCFFDGLSAVTTDSEKVGYKNKKNEWVISPKYNAAQSFSEGLAFVEEKGKWGVINKKGEWIITPQFEDALPFSEGLAFVEEKGKWGVINKKGEWIITPQFEDVRSFSEGLAFVEEKGKWGVINKKGEFIVKPTFSSVVYDYKNGIAQIFDGHRYGEIDKYGNLTWL